MQRSDPDRRGATWARVRSSDGFVSGRLIEPSRVARENLLVCIHGGGCNSNYFDLAGCSMADEASARGYQILLIDRPGYGGNPAAPSDRPIADTAPLILRFIEECRASLPAARGVSLVGHSIGGAIALTLASRRGDWPLAGVAISGIGDRPEPAIRDIRLPRGSDKVDPPAVLTEALFYAGGEPLSWKAIASLRKAAELWLIAEVNDVMEAWPGDWPEVARAVRVPVHLRLAEHERIWSSGRDVVERLAGSLCNAAVDADLLRGGGHLYEVSKRGPELLRAQLDFLDACSAAAPAAAD
jgi:pimeloyl-ACP methyl ester carboxylesterase